MTVEEELARLCADAVGRATDLPALDAVMEDSGRQRLAAYYLYSALLAASSGPMTWRPRGGRRSWPSRSDSAGWTGSRRGPGGRSTPS